MQVRSPMVLESISKVKLTQGVRGNSILNRQRHSLGALVCGKLVCGKFYRGALGG